MAGLSGGFAAMNKEESILKRLGFNENRKARNFLLKPGLQLKLAFYVLFLSLGFVLITVLFGKLYFEQTYVTLVGNTTQSEYIQAVVTQQIHDFKSLSMLLLAVYTVLVVVVATVYTHRMIGPMLPVMRHIKALKEGFYSHRVKLRAHDCFHELADELNELAETLEQRQQQ
jgi:methyl-accepting chemotaxis protein